MTVEWIDSFIEREIERILDRGLFSFNDKLDRLYYEHSHLEHNDDLYLGREDRVMELTIKYYRSKVKIFVFYEWTESTDYSIKYYYHVDDVQLTNERLINKILRTVELKGERFR